MVLHDYLYLLDMLPYATLHYAILRYAALRHAKLYAALRDHTMQQNPCTRYLAMYYVLLYTVLDTVVSFAIPVVRRAMVLSTPCGPLICPAISGR